METIDETVPEAVLARAPSVESDRTPSPSLGERLQEYWHYRELFFFFVWRDIKVRYKQTVLGAAWAVLQPLVAMIVFTLLFGKVAKLPNDGLPYPVFYYTGLLPWTFFAQSLSKSGLSLEASVNLITKIYFPRELVPTSAVLTGLLDFTVASVFLLGIMLVYGVPVTWQMLLWPLFLAPLIVLAVGAGLLFSALNVAYRDVKHALPFLIQMGMFVSPVVYPVTMIPDKYRLLVLLNPVAGIIEAFRSSVSPERSIDWQALGISCLVTLVIFVVGYAYFRKAERSFADVI